MSFASCSRRRYWLCNSVSRWFWMETGLISTPLSITDCRADSIVLTRFSKRSSLFSPSAIEARIDAVSSANIASISARSLLR